MLRKQNENLENEVQQLRDTSDEQDTQEDEIEKLQAKIVSLDKSAALLSHENNGLKSVFKSLDKELKVLRSKYFSVFLLFYLLFSVK